MSTSTTLSEEYIAAYQGDKLIAVAAVFIPIVLICVSLRFYARRLTKAPWGLDDGLVLLSLIVQIGESVLAICFVKYAGVGRHFSALEITEPKVVIRYWKTLLVVSVYYCIVVPLPKLAILAMYWRLLNRQKLYRIAIYIIAGIIITNSIVCTIISLNLCRPFAFNWDRTIPGGTCLNETLFDQMASLPNIITDIPMLVIPIPIVWKLNATKRVKFFLALTLLTGSVGLATSIVRFASFSQESAVDDGTWSSVDLMTWTIVEPDFYLIAACLPTYRPILVHILRESSQLDIQLSR